MKLPTTFFDEMRKNKYLASLPSFKQEKTRQITTLTLTLITLALFGIFAVNPTISTIGQLQKELEDDTVVNEKLTLKIKNLGLLQQQYTTIQNELPTIFNAIPKTTRAAILTGQIQSLAFQHGLKLDKAQVFEVDLSSQKTQKANANTSFTFSVGATGSYQNIADFIKDLTNFDRIVSLDTLSITNGPDGSGLVQVTIRGKAYFKQT